MHVVQVITELRPAGAERVLTDISLGLEARGHRVTVVSLFSLPDRSSIVDELTRAGIRTLGLGITKSRPWRALRLPSALRELRPDVVHTHLMHPNVLSRLPRNRDYALINSVHLVERRRSKRWLLLLDRWSHRRADRITVVSQAVQKFHARILGVDPHALPVIPNGLRPPRRPQAIEIAALRREWKVERCRRVLGSVGRLDRQKGYDRLMGMLPELAGLIPMGERWGLVILGDGPEAETLREAARTAPAAWDVRLPGFRPDAAVAAGAFDLFLMPSRFEGYGLALAEAISHGLPVVASEVDSLPELLEGYPLGRTVSFDHGSAAEVRRAIEELLAQPGLTEGMAPVPLDTMVESYLDVYAHALRSRSP